MRLIGGYLIREISLGILAVLFGFLGLFAFFDLINIPLQVGKILRGALTAGRIRW